MANERAIGLSFVLAAQTWRQVVVCYGEHEARTIYGLSNNLVVFGGGKDIGFYRELSDLIGSTTHTEIRHSTRGAWLGGWFGGMDRSWDQRRVPILEPAELRRIEQRKALVLRRATTRSSRTCTAASTASRATSYSPHSNVPASRPEATIRTATCHRLTPPSL